MLEAMAVTLVCVEGPPRGKSIMQQTTGIILSYMTRMGISSSVVEAMSQTSDVRWLGAREAEAMNLVTDPLRGP